LYAEVTASVVGAEKMLSGMFAKLDLQWLATSFDTESSAWSLIDLIPL
jgi:hypothetical protein